MNDSVLTKIKGFRKLVHDGVKMGADYVQEQQRKATQKPYEILEGVAPIAEPTKAVHEVHNRIADMTYDGIRAVNTIVDVAGAKLINELEQRVGAAQMETAEQEATQPSTQEQA